MNLSFHLGIPFSGGCCLAYVCVGGGGGEGRGECVCVCVCVCVSE